MGQSQSNAQSPDHIPSTTAGTTCPVDHKAREAYLQASASAPGSSNQTSKFLSQRLSTDREVSTIPRAISTASSPHPLETPIASSAYKASHGSPNSETVEGVDPHTSASGHWVYPSEAMFYDAMKRKKYDPRAQDMASVIPIHNAVNERTWYEILRWERPYTASLVELPADVQASSKEKSAGPKLVSFSGDSSKMTPRARWNSFLGYERPFDRHDWVVDRDDGTRIDYVIDFYAGKKSSGPDTSQRSLAPSFYLDVRPKLNSWEGMKMRMSKFIGLV